MFLSKTWRSPNNKCKVRIFHKMIHFWILNKKEINHFFSLNINIYFFSFFPWILFLILFSLFWIFLILFFLILIRIFIIRISIPCAILFFSWNILLLLLLIFLRFVGFNFIGFNITFLNLLFQKLIINTHVLFKNFLFFFTLKRFY